MLLPLVKSKINPYNNLAKNVTLLEQFFHLPYFNISKSIFYVETEKEWSTDLVFSTGEYEEEFYWPSVNYTLSNSEKTHLIKYYKGFSISLSVSKTIYINRIFN
jgi:hypothetical protein